MFCAPMTFLQDFKNKQQGRDVPPPPNTHTHVMLSITLLISTRGFHASRANVLKDLAVLNM